ncbi:MAG TPA: hypothetical protein VFE05_17025 [Longimicrobiaceae bacterium]|jgi:hypothetical protein|nr:hypothetical protein [Longimicrobiaceae bacterium]
MPDSSQFRGFAGLALLFAAATVFRYYVETKHVIAGVLQTDPATTAALTMLLLLGLASAAYFLLRTGLRPAMSRRTG